MNVSAPVTVKVTHPVRGVLWGIPFGVGLAVVATVLKVIPLSPVWLLGITVVGILVGTLWATVGPATAPKGPPPAVANPSSITTPVGESTPGSRSGESDPDVDVR